MEIVGTMNNRGLHQQIKRNQADSVGSNAYGESRASSGYQLKQIPKKALPPILNDSSNARLGNRYLKIYNQGNIKNSVSHRELPQSMQVNKIYGGSPTKLQNGMNSQLH